MRYALQLTNWHQPQEATSQSVTLHDDEPAALVTVLRFIVHPQEVELYHNHMGSIGQLGFGLRRHEWLNASFVTADKYDVPELRDLLIEELERPLRPEQERDFLQAHYLPLRAAYHGAFPRALYQAFAIALGDHNRFNTGLVATESLTADKASRLSTHHARCAGEMQAAAMEDLDLTQYLLNHVGFEGPWL